MSKKCPHCGSYNTEYAIGNWVKRGFINAGRLVLTAGAGMIGSLSSPNNGKVFSYQVWKNTAPSEFFDGYHCCNCKRDFHVELTKY